MTQKNGIRERRTLRWIAMDSLNDRVRQFCSNHNLKLNTDLGQHFLISETVLHCITDGAGIEEDDHIVEIGPGIGILTRELLERSKKVTAIELDARLVPLLKEYVQDVQESKDHLEIIQGNALHVALPETPYRLVANIPYHITSPLLRHVFLESKRQPKSLTLLIQKEVAETICDTEHAGILTIIVGLFGTPFILCQAPATAFLPPPKVDSAVLHIECHPKPLTDTATIEKLLKLVKLSFGQKRKMLRNTIGQMPNGMELLKVMDINPERRPQTLTIEEWIALTKESLKPAYGSTEGENA